MEDKDDRMRSARAGGTSGRKPSANPPAISLSVENDLMYLERRGFDCSSSEARYVVERVSMHRLEAYLRIASDNARAITGKAPAVKEVHDLITYDRRVQAIIFKYIGILESQFRAKYSRYMTSLHGDMAIYDRSLFHRPEKHSAAMESVRRELLHQKRRNRVISSSIESNDGRVPFGVAIEYLSFGTLSKLYDNTADRRVVDGIARSFNINSSKARSWLKTLANVRNICAHFNPYIVLKQIPSTPLPIRGCEMKNSNPFYVFPMLHRMLYSGETEGFNDKNLDYSSRMLDDMTAETIEYAKHYIATVHSLDVPKRFINPSETTWKGTRVDF